MADLKPFVRDLMRGMEQDLGTKLEWVAVDHHNTGHPHTHIIVRGRDDQGQDLVMARHYISNGIRNRARELISLELGPESDLERWQKLYKAMDQERFTMMDRAIMSIAKDNALALEAFARARADASRGLVLMTQANPSFENHDPQPWKSTYLNRIAGAKAPEQVQPTAFDDYIAALAQELESYEKPVAYLHGDTHRFRIDHSLFSRKTNRRFENFIRVETYGSPDIHWVKVTIDDAEPMLFRFDPQIVTANVANHRAK